MIDGTKLFGRGIGYVDAHLLAAARLSENATLWTRDRLLREAAQDLGIAHEAR
jgi:predicted nucleic acid-binding protein